MSRQFKTLFLIVLTVLLFGCAGMQTRTTSSVVDYLYPDQADTVVQPTIPILRPPIRVGIAFVPEKRYQVQGISKWSNLQGNSALTEARKMQLLDKVADHFRALEFVGDIEVIPSAYLTQRGGFANLQQIRTMYGVDVIALVSYDQVQFTDEGALSLTYWTLVGAYVVSGEKNDTSTMVDTVVYDIESRKMLFRAPGTSTVKSSSTLVNLSEELRNDSQQGFELAIDEMIGNLDLQLQRFRDKIKQNPAAARVVPQQGYSGGGIFSLLDAAMLLLLLLSGAIVERRKNPVERR